MKKPSIVADTKKNLRTLYRRARRTVVRWFLSYSKAELVQALRKLGVRSGDAIMLHSAFEPHHGFEGTEEDVIDAFLEAVAPGDLLMVSLPYRTSSLEYLQRGKRFDVRKTPSTMGLVSEYFRRRGNVLRSLHPTHPILVCGSRAEWFIAEHEQCLYPCGPGTPFDKLLEVGGKVVFFNVPFAYFTFFHYLEHWVSSRLKFPLYHEPAFEVPVIDRAGKEQTVRTFVYSSAAIARRRFPILEEQLRRRRLIRGVRVGATQLLAVELREVMVAVEEMTQQNIFFYDTSETGSSPC